MKKPLFLTVLAAGLLLLGAACTNKDDNTNTSATTNTVVVNTNTGANANVDGTTNANANTNAAKATATEHLKVTVPAKAASVTSPITVTGSSDQGTYAHVDLKDSTGKVLTTSAILMTKGAFTSTVTTTYKGAATLEFYQKSLANGSHINVVDVPVTVK